MQLWVIASKFVRVSGAAEVPIFTMIANYGVIAHLWVARLTMSRDDGSITLRSAAVGTGGELRTAGDACWLSAGSSKCTGQDASTGDSSCDRDGAK